MYMLFINDKDKMMKKEGKPSKVKVSGFIVVVVAM